MTISSNHYWAIISNISGYVVGIQPCDEWTKEEMMEDFEKIFSDHKTLEGRGYRCVKVEIKEVEE